MADERQMTYGEKLVGLNFNPSGDEKVTKLKTLFAEIIDICQDGIDKGGDPQTRQFYAEAIMRSLDAQMWTVKAATWRK